MTLTEVGSVLDVARSQLGVTEDPPNTNRGERVETYLRTVGLKAGDPWCAAFVAWVGVQALAKRWPVPLVGGCATLGAWGRKEGRLRDEPQMGDIFVLWFPKLKRFAHTGFVVGRLADGSWATIEGNTSGGGSREGWGVFQRTRRFGPDDKFIRWWTNA